MGFGKINLRGSRPLVPKINLGLNWKPAPKWWFWILFNHLEMPDIFSFPCFSERGIKIEQLCSIGNMEISLELFHSDIFKAKRMNSTSISIPPSWALTRKGDTTSTFPPTEPFRTKRKPCSVLWVSRQTGQSWEGESELWNPNGQKMSPDCGE